MKKMNSINQTAKLCKEMNIGIGRKLIIKLAKDGSIPCIKSGKSILINWDGLMEYLDCHTITSEKDKSYIRKVSV